MPEDRNANQSPAISKKPITNVSSKEKMDVDPNDGSQSASGKDSVDGDDEKGVDNVSPVKKSGKPRKKSLRSQLKGRTDVIGAPLPRAKRKQQQNTGGQDKDRQGNDGSESEEDTTNRPVIEKSKRRSQKQAFNMEDGDSKADDEFESEEETIGPPVVPPKHTHQSSSTAPGQNQQAITELEKEAAVLLKPNSYTVSGFKCSEASRVLVAVLGLSSEERDAFLTLSHDELVKGFKKQVKKQLMKNREVDHLHSPAHKRPRHN